MTLHPVGWISLPGKFLAQAEGDSVRRGSPQPSSNGRQDQLSTAVGWLPERGHPQDAATYPQTQTFSVEGHGDSSRTVPDDVSRETLTQDNDDE